MQAAGHIRRWSSRLGFNDEPFQLAFRARFELLSLLGCRRKQRTLPERSREIAVADVVRDRRRACAHGTAGLRGDGAMRDALIAAL